LAKLVCDFEDFILVCYWLW